jgi:hypothetical protein
LHIQEKTERNGEKDMEHHRFEKPLSFGEILDVTFRTIKENFSRLFLIMLIFMGPLELLISVDKSLGGVSLLRAPNSGEGLVSFLNSFTQTGTQSAILDTVYFLLLIFISAPMAYASLIVATDQIRKNEPVNILSAIKRAFSRYWALLGGSMVLWLIMFALIISMTLLITAYLAISGGAKSFTGLAAGTSAGFGIHLVVIIVLSISAFCGFIYLMIRWSFFYAAIVFEKVSPGLGKSWELTRGHFWRLVGLYIVLSIIIMIISGIFQIAVYFFLGNSVLAYLLISLVSLPISMTSYIAYAVIYFDLRVRNEAMDLKEMIETYPNNPNSSSTIEAAETNQEV